MHIGLVLSAGGVTGGAYHAAVLDTLAQTTGWDPRSATVIVGTSAGAITAGSLRSGLSAADHLARITGEALSPAGQVMIDRVTSTFNTDQPQADRDRWPAHPNLIWRGLTSGFRPVVAIAGLLPAGSVTTDGLGARVNELAGTTAWPSEPTWICAVDGTTGRRMVFGRDDHEPVDLGTAVRASAAVPGRFAPAMINDRPYIDGGVHSPTNADLIAPLGLDAVVVSSSMSAASPDWRAAPNRAWHHRTLHRELAAVTRSGTPVLVIEPDQNVVDAQGHSNMDRSQSRAVAAAAQLAAEAALQRADSKVLDRLGSAES